MKAGARSLGRDVADKVKSTIGGGAKSSADVWETATTEAPGDEPPECQWCPICRAARRYRDSGGTSAGMREQLAGVGDTLAGFAQDAFSLFETAMRAQQQRQGTRPDVPDDASKADRDAGSDYGRDAGSDYGTVVGPGVAWPTVVHPQDEDGESGHEGGDREEGGQPGDGPPDSGGDEQVEGPAE
jgi:hypothetical protein